MSRYRGVYESWKADPEAFWANAADAVHWAKPYDKVFDATAGQYGRWFPGALCNTRLTIASTGTSMRDAAL